MSFVCVVKTRQMSDYVAITLLLRVERYFHILSVKCRLLALSYRKPGFAHLPMFAITQVVRFPVAA